MTFYPACRKRLHHILLSLLCAAHTAPVLSDNFSPFHARSMAMGGTGVASARSSEATNYNPALLVQQAKEDDFEFNYLALGVIAADDDKLIDEIDDFDKSGIVDEFDAAINSFNAAVDIDDLDAANLAIDDIVASLNELNDRLVSLDLKALRANFGAGISVSFPGSTWGFAFAVNSTASVAGIFDYRDEGVVTLYADGLDALADDLLNNTEDPNDPSKPYYAIIEDLGGSARLKDPSLDSLARAVGMSVTDVSFSVARSFEFAKRTFSLAITPKLQYIHTVDYVALAVDEGNSGLSDFQDEISDSIENDEDFNVDLSGAYEYDAWMLGLSLRNLIARDVESALGNKFELDPSAHAGLAYRGKHMVFSVDMDLTEQQGFISQLDTQFLAAGVEFKLPASINARLGYRYNLSNSDQELITAGLGFNWPVSLEIALAASPDGDEYGLVLQLGGAF